MSLKISQYTTSVSALASGDLMDVSKLISTSPDVYSSDKLNYSVLLTEIIADGSILTGSGTTNFISKFSSSGTLANSSLRDDGNNVSINNAVDASYKLYINSDKLVGLGVFNNAASGGNNFGISGSATNANTGSNIGVFGNALLSSAGTNLGVRGMAASETVTTSPNIVAVGSNVGGFFQANASSGISYGLVATADATTDQASATFTGAYIRAYNAGTKYSVRLVDGSEGTGKFLKSVTSIGQANWAALAITDITASLGTSLQVVRMNAAATALEYATLSSSNLGNANLTADAAERSYTLFGNTANDKLIFKNLAGDNILNIYGSGQIGLFSNSGSFANLTIGSASSTKTIYGYGGMWFTGSSGSNYEAVLSGSGEVISLNKLSNGTTAGFVGGGNDPYILQKSATICFLSYNVSANEIHYLDNRGFSQISDTGGLIQVRFSSQTSFNFLGRDFRVGGLNGTPNSKIEIIGNGSTSATTTALFQNSSSVNALKIRDDNYLIQRALNAAIADADLANNEMSAYINESTSFIIFKVKTSTGVVKTASIALV
jgi:hypothetical protein